jgi:hypothetical protein
MASERQELWVPIPVLVQDRRARLERKGLNRLQIRRFQALRQLLYRAKPLAQNLFVNEPKSLEQTHWHNP